MTEVNQCSFTCNINAADWLTRSDPTVVLAQSLERRALIDLFLACHG